MNRRLSKPCVLTPRQSGQWDIDPEGDDGGELPNEITIPNDIEDEEAISDYISDVTGFCHKGFELEEQL